MSDRPDRPDRPAVPPVLPRLSKDVFTTAPPWPQSARQVKDNRTLPGLDNSQGSFWEAKTAPGSPRGRESARHGAHRNDDRRKDSNSPHSPRDTMAVWENSEEEFSEALKSVRLWWKPVEAAIRGRRVDLLQGALKEAHGESYLRTVYAVRRSASLDPAHRHSVEMEMAARLVKARAVLGKWQAGVEEIKKAHRARDVGGLAQALSRFQHSADDAEVSGARQDLERWRRLAEELPKLLKEALDRRDVPKLREAIVDMSKDGPMNIDGAEEAKKMIKRYQIRARALDHAVGERKISSIQAALATWDFGRDDIHAVKARQAIARRDQQKQKLQEAVQKRDGPRLHQVVNDWEFDRSDEDFQESLQALTRYEKMIMDVGRMMGPPMDIVALAHVLDNWEWSKDDLVRLATQKRISEHENAARNALEAKDGWKLQRIWQFDASVKPKGKGGTSALHNQMAGIKWKATVAKNRYREATNALREAIHDAVEESDYMRAEAFAEVEVPEGEDAIQAPHPSVLMSLTKFGVTGMPPKEHDLHTLVENWPFSSDDPTVQLAAHWLHSRSLLKKSSVSYLVIAINGGHSQSIVKAYSRAAAVAVPPRIYHKFVKLPSNILRAKEEALMREAIMQAVGAMCLGVEPHQLILASGFAKEMAEKARLVRNSAAQIEAGRIPTLRAASRPPRLVHAVVETICHCVAGIQPTVRDPPRDTGWRTCQRMLNNQKALMENLIALPDWIQSGRMAPIKRAKEHWQEVQREMGRRDKCSVDAVRRHSLLAGQFLHFLLQVFGFYDLLTQASVAPDKRKGAHEIVRDVDAHRLVELQAVFSRLKDEAQTSEEFAHQPLWYYALKQGSSSLASHLLFSSAWAIVGGSAEAVADCVRRAQLQHTQVLAVTAVSNAALGSISRGLRPPSREHATVVEPRRSSKFLTMGAGHIDRMSEGSKGALQGAGRKIEASRAFKHGSASHSLREVDVIVIRITGEEAAVLHMSQIATVKEVQDRLQVLEQIPAEKQILLVDNKEVPASAQLKNLRKDRETSVYFTLLYKSNALVHRIEASMLKVAQCSVLDFELTSLLGGKLSDPAICLIYGTSSFDGTVARPGDGARRQGARRTAIDMQNTRASTQAFNLDEFANVRAVSPGSPRKQSLQIVMLDLMRTMIEIIRAHSWGIPRFGSYAVQVDSPWQMQVVTDILELSSGLLRKPLVPQANLCISMRLLEELEEAGLPATYQPEFGLGRRTSRDVAGSVPQTPHTPHTPHTASSATDRETISSRQTLSNSDKDASPPPREGDYQRGLLAVSAFIRAVKAYYDEFFPVRSMAAANMAFLLQAEKAFKESGKVQRLSMGLENMCQVPQDCRSLEDVMAATNLACDQLLVLADQGIAIVNPHVEYVRCAIDSAGLSMLNCPPAADPLQRLQWAEAIMAIQVSPMPLFDQTLRKIARTIEQNELAELAALPEPPENMQHGALGTGVERLFAALAWVLDPECYCDKRWSQSRLLLEDAEGFAEELESWSSAQADVSRLARARNLLMEVWTWVSAGCNGSLTLQSLFCWLTLAVSVVPLAQQAVRLKPVHSTVKSGLQRVGLAAPHHRASSAAKAWTAALFLLDGTAEAWWWLKGIRSFEKAPRPWTDSEDGGVGVAQSASKPEDVWQQGEDPFDGNDPTAGALEFDRDLDKEIDDVLRDDGYQLDESTSLHRMLRASAPDVSVSPARSSFPH